MKFLIIGLGSIGKRHVMNLTHSGVFPEQIYGVETREDRRRETMEKFGINTIFSKFDDCSSEQFDAAFLCLPTAYHIDPAIALAKKGTHIFMEKPLSHNLGGIEELAQVVKEKKVKFLMAYIFRFSEAVRKLKELLDSQAIGKVLYFRGEFSEYLPDWHPWEDYRSFYMAKKSMGGGSILDQSHIIDLAHFLFGEVKEVFCVNEKFSDLEVEADDIAEITAYFESGLVGSIHMDMFGREHKKFMEIKGSSGNISWDFYDFSVKIFSGEKKSTKTYHFKKEANQMYLAETSHFLNCVKGAEEPFVDLGEGIHTMKIIDAAERSSKEKRVITVN